MQNIKNLVTYVDHPLVLMVLSTSCPCCIVINENAFARYWRWQIRELTGQEKVGTANFECTRWPLMLVVILLAASVTDVGSYIEQCEMQPVLPPTSARGSSWEEREEAMSLSQ